MKRILAMALALITCGSMVAAQEAAPEKASAQKEAAVEQKPSGYYRLDFSIREMQDNKVVNTRAYSMVVEDGNRGSLKTGARVPVLTGAAGSAQYSYMNIGMEISCLVRSRADYVALDTSVEMETIASSEQTPTAPMSPPVVRTSRTAVRAGVIPGKPTIIGSLDDPQGNRRFQIEVTATKLK